ncbi:hypothetical protein [Selenomonas sp. KH1T6]|uniref:hypothetical protein n=1 Tax=Selenomonas sp. KH1T6 TaxID=3158784 RepID=UPI0008A7CB43|nr:serine/threonine-protein kinase HipA [Selenomonas ruminantium]
MGITEEDSSLDMSLTLETAEFYQLSLREAKEIVDSTKSIVAENWRKLAARYGISRIAVERMSSVFAEK